MILHSVIAEPGEPTPRNPNWNLSHFNPDCIRYKRDFKLGVVARHIAVTINSTYATNVAISQGLLTGRRVLSLKEVEVYGWQG